MHILNVHVAQIRVYRIKDTLQNACADPEGGAGGPDKSQKGVHALTVRHIRLNEI